MEVEIKGEGKENVGKKKKERKKRNDCCGGFEKTRAL